MTDIVARALASQALQNKGVNQFNSKNEFPNVGQEEGLYIDNINNQVYYWNESKLAYVPLISGDQDIPTEVAKIVPKEVEKVLPDAIEDNLNETIFHGGNSLESI